MSINITKINATAKFLGLSLVKSSDEALEYFESNDEIETVEQNFVDGATEISLFFFDFEGRRAVVVEKNTVYGFSSIAYVLA